MLATALVMAAAAALLNGAGQAPPAQPVFRAVGASVPVHATVTDRAQRLVTNLTVDAFTISDDHGVRPITIFERRVVPISVVLLLDTSYSMRDSIAFLRSAAKHFVAQLLPTDRVEIGAFNTDIRLVRPFTSDQRALHRILDFVGPKMTDFGTALWPAMCEGLKELGGLQDRKVLLVFSDGENNVGDFKQCPIVAQAIAQDVMIYAIALKTQYIDAHTRERMTSVLDPRLPGVAEATGGGYFELTRNDDLAATFARVAEELHHQYTLGFDAPVLDGRTHEITVTVKGEGLTARARRSYLAALPK
jgi:Ca-activated chloride channel family protein